MRGAHLFGMLVFRGVCICYKIKRVREEQMRVKNEGRDIVQKLFCLSLCCVEGAIIWLLEFVQCYKKKGWNYDGMNIDGHSYKCHSFKTACIIANFVFFFLKEDNLPHLKLYQGAN